jgi:hypothetical protein
LEPGFCASPETSRSGRADAQFGNGAGERVFFARVIVPACMACARRDPSSRALRAPRYPPLHVRAVVPSTGVARMRVHACAREITQDDKRVSQQNERRFESASWCTRATRRVEMLDGSL